MSFVVCGLSLVVRRYDERQTNDHELLGLDLFHDLVVEDLPVEDGLAILEVSS